MVRSKGGAFDTGCEPRLSKAGRALATGFTALYCGTMARTSHHEVEIKLRVSDKAAIRRRMKQIGARKVSRVHERNTLFDTPDGVLRRAGKLLRIRWNKSDAVLTFKEPVQGSTAHKNRYKVRREIEFPIPRPGQLEDVLAGMGFVAGYKYEKIRTTYRLRSEKQLKIELDDTPMGCFIELEGTRRAIDRVARRLGYAPADYITANYMVLYHEYCKRRGQWPGNMLFANKR